jgi:uncharacterized protein with PhoU and TrkA domain
MQLEASVEVLVRALRCYLVSDDEVGRQVKELRRRAFGIEKAARPALVQVEELTELLPEVALEVVRVEPGCELEGKTLAEAALPARTGCSVVALRRGGETTISVKAGTVVLCEDILVFLGPSPRMPEALCLVRAAMPQPV